MAARDRLERLTPLDASNLRVEDRGLPMHVAALVILGRPTAAGPPGQLDLDTGRRTVERRLHLAPRLRQMLRPPRPGLGPPVWVDDPGFDVRQHIRALVNLLVSNLPGPPAVLSFAGAPVLEIFQIGVVQGNLCVSVGALSYAGQLSLCVVGDPGAVPDLAVFADGMSDALRQLGALAQDGPAAPDGPGTTGP